MRGIRGAAGAVTLDCQTQFLSRGTIDAPLDSVIETLRETGRLIFIRGLLEQGEVRVAAFSATLRKASVRA